jgi:hypothetical protein
MGSHQLLVAWTHKIAHLGSRKVVTASECGRVSVKRWRAIFVLRIVGKVRKGEETRNLWLALFLEVSWIHYVFLSIEGCRDQRDNDG